MTTPLFADAQPAAPVQLLWTTAEAAHVLRVHTTTVRRAVASGALGCCRPGETGRSLRFSRAQLEAYVAYLSQSPFL